MDPDSAALRSFRYKIGDQYICGFVGYLAQKSDAHFYGHELLGQLPKMLASLGSNDLGIWCD